MRLRVKSLAPVLALLLPVASLLAETQQNDGSTQRTLLHQSDQWALLQPHLPNPDSASAATLETAGDVLRARRFPEDAIEYYRYALAKGGDAALLNDKIGVAELDIHQTSAARASFVTSLKANKHYAPAWNNLGVMEALSGNFSRAVSYYQHAARIDSVTATYHANAGMAYFEMKEIENARRELSAAIQIDPLTLQKHSESGLDIQMLEHGNYGQFAFEMAKLFAMQKDVEQVHVWLAKAKSNGYDLQSAMRLDPVMYPYLKDPEVKMILAGTSPGHREAVSALPGASGPMQRNFN